MQQTYKPLQNFDIAILLETADILAINKPAGVVVNRAQSVKVETLQDWVEWYLQNDTAWKNDRTKDQEFLDRSGMVHRLDKDTSGVILFAKRSEAMHTLMAQFKAREVQKTYVALVHGHLPTKDGVVRAAIQRHPKQREKFSVSSAGRSSETYFKVKKEFSFIRIDKLLSLNKKNEQPIRALEKEVKIYEGGFSLVELQPKTGRTHQIRVHMQFLHHPLLGDFRYSGRRRARLDAIWCPRQFLHAANITFFDPGDKKEIYIEAPLAADLRDVLQFLTE